MVRIFCDICNKELEEHGSNQVNLQFCYYGLHDFEVVLNGKNYNNELNLCKDCADSVVSDIEDLKRIADANRREKC